MIKMFNGIKYYTKKWIFVLCVTFFTGCQIVDSNFAEKPAHSLQSLEYANTHKPLSLHGLMDLHFE